MASSIYSITARPARSKLAVVRDLRSASIAKLGSENFLRESLNPTVARFNAFWELMETIKKHGYIRAAMSVVGRSAVGAWWTLRKHSEYGKTARERQRKRLIDFYMMRSRQWDNIKDYYNFAYKIMISAMYLRYFGQAAFYIVRDDAGQPVGLDFLNGLVIPNVDRDGKFKTPGFVQYPTPDPTYRVDFNNPKDIVYLVNPDFEGSPMGGSDIQALSTFTLPLDIYLLIAARDYMKNRDRPEVVYSLPSDISEDAFDEFVKEMESRHAGPRNLGRNPIAVQGEFSVTELSPLPDSLPYQDARKDTREESLAVAGVNGAKLGLSESLASANLREMRREFHETTMLPLFKLIEDGFYEQIHVREFNTPGWEFKFNSPDFLNAVERATVHMRYHQMGALSPNEIRHDLGRQARGDEQGDMYADQLENKTKPENPQGSPPEGREQEPDDPSQIGEPTLDDQDPVRGDQHDEEPRQEMLDELRRWKTFAMKRMKAGKPMREFRSDIIPAEINSLISSFVARANTVDELAQIFEDAMEEVKDAGYIQ